MEYLKKETIEEALSLSYRQYLTGHLQRPQPFLRHIEDDTEIGISYYKEYMADVPHVHTIAAEHAFVLSGSVRCRLLDGSGMELQFDAGDFFTFRPGEAHATKNAPGTKVLFIKVPGVNDKTPVEVDMDTHRWLESWERD